MSHFSAQVKIDFNKENKGERDKDKNKENKGKRDKDRNKEK